MDRLEIHLYLKSREYRQIAVFCSTLWLCNQDPETSIVQPMLRVGSACIEEANCSLYSIVVKVCLDF